MIYVNAFSAFSLFENILINKAEFFLLKYLKIRSSLEINDLNVNFVMFSFFPRKEQKN